MTAEHPGQLMVTNSVVETLELGRKIAGALKPGSIVAMDGPLGSGKTVLVRGMVEGLGGNTALVGSPTFGLVHEYPIDDNRRLIHMDCYRMGGQEDLESIGWFGFAGTEDSLTVVEWADRIAEALPDHTIRILAGHQAQDSRVFEIHGIRIQSESSSSSSGKMP
jgi:tRNA threonylcarbamoyladenosine biosynthesis protein TsaE